MKIISFILTASILMTSCASKHKGESAAKSANASTKKVEKNSTEPNPKPAEKPAPPPAPAKDMYKCTDEVSLRVSPVSYSKVSMKIMKGESVELLEKTSEDCWKIKYRNELGYTNPKNLSK